MHVICCTCLPLYQCDRCPQLRDRAQSSFRWDRNFRKSSRFVAVQNTNDSRRQCILYESWVAMTEIPL